MPLINLIDYESKPVTEVKKRIATPARRVPRHSSVVGRVGTPRVAPSLIQRKATPVSKKPSPPIKRVTRGAVKQIVIP